MGSEIKIIMDIFIALKKIMFKNTNNTSAAFLRKIPLKSERKIRAICI